MPTGLSAAGAREAWSAALDALDDAALDRVAARGGEPFDTATFVAAGTVPAAPIEWCAVLLGRGTRLTLKTKGGAPGFAPLLEEAAGDVGLPLVATSDRTAIGAAELVIAMGSDAAIGAVRAAVRPGARFRGFGHRFSVAWWDAAAADALALDVAMYDTRGCFSPVVVFATGNATLAADALAAALERAARRWPIGDVSDREAAEIRARGALARVVGSVREGTWGSIHVVPRDRVRPVALPRSVLLAGVRDVDEAVAAIAPWRHQLSTVGSDDAAVRDAWAAAGAPRVCGLGQMQRPPLERLHDGVDWIASTAR